MGYKPRTCKREGCSTNFIPQSGRQLYCSTKCRDASARERLKHPCEAPGCQVLVHRQSRFCARHAPRIRHKSGPRANATFQPRECGDCGKTYVPKAGNQKRCSDCKERRDRELKAAYRSERQRPCAHSGCERLVSAENHFCMRHMGIPRRRHYRAPLADLQGRLPDPAASETLQALFVATMADLGIDAKQLARWVGLHSTVVYRILTKPTTPLAPGTQRKIAAFWGCSADEIERLRPSRDAWKTHARKIRLTKIGPSGPGRPRRRAKARPHRNAWAPEAKAKRKTSMARKLADPEYRARRKAVNLVAQQKNRKLLTAWRPLIRDLHKSGWTTKAIYREINHRMQEEHDPNSGPPPAVSNSTVRRVMGEMGLIRLDAHFPTPGDIRAAYALVRSRSVQVLHENNAHRQAERWSDFRRAYQAVWAERGKKPSKTWLRHKTGAHPYTIQTWMDNPAEVAWILTEDLTHG